MERERKREGKEIRSFWYASDKNLHSKESLYPFCERRDRETVDRTEMRVVTTGIQRAGRGTHPGWGVQVDHPQGCPASYQPQAHSESLSGAGQSRGDPVK